MQEQENVFFLVIFEEEYSEDGYSIVGAYKKEETVYEEIHKIFDYTTIIKTFEETKYDERRYYVFTSKGRVYKYRIEKMELK